MVSILNQREGNLQFTINDQSPEIISQKKFHYVDPEFLEPGEIHILSVVDSTFAQLVQDHRNINERGIKVSLI